MRWHISLLLTACYREGIKYMGCSVSHKSFFVCVRTYS